MICADDTDFTYKGFVIALEKSPLDAFVFDILKLVQGKQFYLLRKEKLYSSTDEAVYNACQIIDENEEMLTEQFKPMFESFCEEVISNSKWYYLEQTEINTLYFIKMKYKLVEIAKSTNL